MMKKHRSLAVAAQKDAVAWYRAATARERSNL